MDDIIGILIHLGTNSENAREKQDDFYFKYYDIN